MFRKTLTNPYFGAAMFEYYASGKTIPKHAKYVTVGFIALMASLSAYFVWYVSTRGEGVLTDPATWNGADPGFGRDYWNVVRRLQGPDSQVIQP